MIAGRESQVVVLCRWHTPDLFLQLSALKLATLRKNLHKRAKSCWLPSARRPGLCFEGKWVREWGRVGRI